MREDRGGELARGPQVLAHRPRRRSATPSSAAALAATPPLKNGLARLSPATSPGRGAQLASTRGACGGAFARAVARPFNDRAARAPHDHGGVRRTCSAAGCRWSERQRVEAIPRRSAGPARSEAERLIDSRRGPKPPLWAAGRCTARAGGRSEEGPPARAVLAPVPSSPRATKPPGAPFRAFPRRPPGFDSCSTERSKTDRYGGISGPRFVITDGTSSRGSGPGCWRHRKRGNRST